MFLPFVYRLYNCCATLCLMLSLLNVIQDSHAQYASNVRIGAEIRGEVCRHDYRLNEEIGIICRLCGFVSTEIKDVPPPFVSQKSRTYFSFSYSDAPA